MKVLLERGYRTLLHHQLQSIEAKPCSSYVATADELDAKCLVSRLVLSGQELVHHTKVIRWDRGNTDKMVREKEP